MGIGSNIPTLFVTPSGGVDTFGLVGIGTSNPQSALAVNGTVTAREIVVTNSGWPDYVFADDYQLMSLEEVETFIKTNKHLPNIPSEYVIENEGLPVSDMTGRRMEKIEELTLHVIELNKKVKKLEAENERLNKEGK